MEKTQGIKKMLSIIIPVKDPEPYYPFLVREIECILNKLDITYEILIQKEKGLTNAIIQGVKHSRYEFILVMDSDGSHDPSYIPLMLDYLYKGFDVVVGSKVYDETSNFRKFISAFFREVANSVIGINMHDCMSGFVLGKRAFFENLKPSFDYKFLLQILIQHPKVVEYAIHFHKRKMGSSKANILTGLRTLTNICKIGLSRRTRN